jgi:hypothetical protein
VPLTRVVHRQRISAAAPLRARAWWAICPKKIPTRRAWAGAGRESTSACRPTVAGLSDRVIGLPQFGFFPPGCAVVGTSPLGLGRRDTCNSLADWEFHVSVRHRRRRDGTFRAWRRSFLARSELPVFRLLSIMEILSHSATVTDRERNRHSSLVQVSSFLRSEPDARLSYF